jgi:hypothetical protein
LLYSTIAQEQYQPNVRATPITFPTLRKGIGDSRLVVTLPALFFREEVERVDNIEYCNGEDHRDTVKDILVDLVCDKITGPALSKLDGSVDTYAYD